MKLQLVANFGDLLRFFAALNVKYLVVGDWAVSVHAQPRATLDMDILVSAEPSSAAAVYKALAQFGAPLENLDKNRFLEPGTFFRVGVPPCQIDIFTKIDGVGFEECWPNRVEVAIDQDGIARFISAGDLVKQSRKWPATRHRRYRSDQKGSATTEQMNQARCTSQLIFASYRLASTSHESRRHY